MIRCILYTLAILFCSCGTVEKEKDMYNPPAEGFNEEQSDSRAITIADSVVWAHGGREAWDATSYIKWNFFDARRHVWNKNTGDLLIEGIRDTFYIEMNLDNMEGKVNYRGEELTHPDSLSKYLQLGKEMWINDVYWLILPFKLKDSGVTLSYLGSIQNDSLGRMEQISLTFDNVGVTPDNKYVLTINGADYTIHQWDFFRNAQDVAPQFSTKWTNYKAYGDIILSSGRSTYELTEIAVGDSLQRYFNLNDITKE